MTPTAPHKLGDRELDIMQSLWRRRSATVADVRQDLARRGRALAYTTVQTMLNRLEAKRCVTRDDAQRVHRYRPLLREPVVVTAAVRGLTERFFKGSASELATHLIDRGLSPAELDRIQELIDAHRARRRGAPRTRGTGVSGDTDTCGGHE